MQDMAAQLSGLGRLYNNPQAGDFGRITGLGMTPGVGAAAGSIFQASEAGIHGYDRGIVFHGVQSVNAPCWARATIPTPCAMRPWAP